MAGARWTTTGPWPLTASHQNPPSGWFCVAKEGWTKREWEQDQKKLPHIDTTISASSQKFLGNVQSWRRRKKSKKLVSGKEEAMRADNIDARRNMLLQEGAKAEQARLLKLNREEARLMQEKAIREEFQITLQ